MRTVNKGSDQNNVCVILNLHCVKHLSFFLLCFRIDGKPSGTTELEEDEGFSDWSQKLEQRNPRSPRRSYEEEEGNLMEAEAKLGQIHLDQESPIFIRFPEEEAELDQQQKLNEDVGIREENEDVREELQDVEEEPQHVAEENRHEEEKKCKRSDVFCHHMFARNPLSIGLFCSPSSNSVKKTQPPLPVSKIDDKLEQYTHAIETSIKSPKPVRQLSIDLPSTSAAVASTKSLWETGEVAQTSVKTTPCKDIVAGDIVNKRSLWEQKESPRTDENVKKLPGKKYKYVATGHGQYKKVLIEDGATEK
uniref:Lymphocyte specific protein 1 n=1 Tax=Podarcis muralis TaxID=64176 RepID=A0A670I9X9_PODMU